MKMKETMNTSLSSSELQPSTGRRLHGWGLATVMTGLLLSLLLSSLDQTIVSTALPTIVGELHGFSLYAWVATAYLLASTTINPIVGKLSDQFGRKWFLCGGIVLFLLGSALSGLSQTITQLICFRGLQGMGAGCMTPLVSALIGDIFPPAERGRWQGLIASISALAAIIGPAVGGMITDHTTWRWIFYVNLPIGLLAVIALLAWLPVSISERSSSARGWAAIGRIDGVGALTSATATICLLLGLSWGGNTAPWASPQVIGILAAAGLLYLAFFFVERNVREPILPLDLLRNQVFTVGALLSLGFGFVLFGMIYYLPLFIQAVIGQTSLSSSAALTPLMLANTGGAILAGALVAKLGRYRALSLIGTGILTCGSLLLTTMMMTTPLVVVTITMGIVGMGIGVVLPLITLAVQNALPAGRLGVGTSAITYLRTTGATIGTAVLATLVVNVSAIRLPAYLPAAARTLSPVVLAQATYQQILGDPSKQNQVVQAAIQAGARQVPAGPAHAQQVSALAAQLSHLFTQIFTAGRLSLADGLHMAFLVMVGVSVAMFVLTLFLKDVALRKTAPGVPEAQAAKGARIEHAEKPSRQ